MYTDEYLHIYNLNLYFTIMGVRQQKVWSRPYKSIQLRFTILAYLNSAMDYKILCQNRKKIKIRFDIFITHYLFIS